MRFVAVLLCLGMLLGFHSPPAPASAGEQASAEQIIAHRQEAIAYSVGLQAYFYGYPVVDYLRVMREQINQGLDPNGVYAPVNQIAYQEDRSKSPGFSPTQQPINQR